MIPVLKNPSTSAGGSEAGSIPESGISLRKEVEPTPVFLLRESHGQRKLVGYSPGGCKELDRTERRSTHTHTHTHTHTIIDGGEPLNPRLNLGKSLK